MKRRKVLLLIPMFGLLLSGCSFAEVKSAIGDSWFGQHILHPIYDPIKNWINGGSKDEPTPEPGPSEKTVASIVSVSAPSTIKQGETLAASSVTLNVKYSDDSTGTEKATRVELDTSEPGEKEGTAYYNELSAKFNITVEKKSADPEHAGTDEDPFTVEDALLVGGALEKGGVTDKEYVIKGFVTSVKADFSTEYGNLTFNMGDFLCYRVFKGSEKAKFESQDDVQVGDRVTVHSKIKNYNGTIETVEKEGYTTAIEKVDHGKISEIVSVVGPTSVALNGTITPEEVTVTIKYEDGFVTTVHAKTVELDTKTAGDKEAVVTIDGFEGTGKFAVKVVEGELPNEIEAAYAKAETLKNDGTEVSSESYLIRGVVVGVRGTDDYFVQSGSYGLDVYKPDSSAGFAVGKEVELKATVCNYKGLYETKAITAGSAKVIGNAQLPTPADVTSESVHNGLKMNILAKASGVVKEDVTVEDNKDVSFTLTVGGSYDVTIFVKKSLVASFPALSTYKAGDALSIENLVTGQYNANKQLLVCNNTTISKGADPTKTVTEILSIDGPTSIEVGQSLSESQFDVEVKYDDNSTAHVSATSLGEFDNSKAATHVGVEVYVGTVHATHYIDVVEHSSDREALPYTLSITNGTLPEAWDGNGEKFDNAYYALKGNGKHMFAKALIEPVAQLDVSVLGICNGASTDSTVTVYGLNDAGEHIEGATATFTPDKVTSNNKAAVDSNATTKTVSITGTNITGVEIELTVKGHNYVIKSVTLESSAPVVDVTSVSLDSHELALHLDGQGEQQPGSGTLTATVLPNDATDPSITWTTSDDKVATVEGGVVTAVGQGTATITATAGAQSDTCTVSVAQHVKSINISGPTGVVVGETSEQSVTVEILPANAPQGVTIVSLDETKATINNEHKIVGVAEGDVTIRATSTDNSLVAEYVVHVAAEVIPVTAVEIEGAETQNLDVGSDLVLSGAVVPPNTTQSTELNWTIVSGDSVTLEGSTVTGVKAGDSVIRATAVANSECHDEVTIHVSNVPATGITLDKENLNLAPEGSYDLVATVAPENATVKTVEWSSNDPNVATVDQTGHVVAVADGTATITAAWTEDSSVKATCTVSVETPVLPVEETVTASSFGLADSYSAFSSSLPETGFFVQGNAKLNSTDEIQLRALTDGSGIYTRTSNRNIQSIIFTFANETMAEGRTVSVYGRDAGYTAPSNEGTLLGTVDATKQGVETIEVTGSYKNVSIVASGALYIDSIKFVWDGHADPVSVTGVTIDKSDVSIGVGEAEQTTLSAIVDGVGCSQDVVWESEDPSIATVVDGVVTGVAAGTVNIKAKAADDNSVYGECAVTVTTTSTLLTCDFSLKSASHSAYNDEWSYDDFSVYGGANNSAQWGFIKLGKKSGNSTNTITTSSAVNHTVSSVRVEIGTGSLSKNGMTVSEWGLIVKNGNTTVETVVSSVAITASAATVTFVPGSGTEWASGYTYQVYFTCGNTTTTNGIVVVNSVSIIG